MNPATPSSTSGRCGMCGSCGTMPPWAPEMLKNTSPEARLALQRRMQEAQKRFIEERDARNQEKLETQPHDRSLDSQSEEDEIEVNTNDSITLSNDGIAEARQNRDDEEQNMKPLSEQTLERPVEEKEKSSVTCNEVSREAQTDASAGTDIQVPTTPLPGVSENEVEHDANVQIPLDNMGVPPLPPSHCKEHHPETPNFHPDNLDILQPLRRKPPQLYSPAVLESPVLSSTPELQALPDMALEPNQLSEPLRTISLRDTESDADSFHTAQGEELLRFPSDSLSLKNGEELNKSVAPIVSEVEWQAFQDDEVVIASEPEVSASKTLKPEVSESPIISTEDNASMEGHTRDTTSSERSSFKAKGINSHRSENLEESAIKEPSTSPGPSSPQAQQDALIDDYGLAVDLVKPNEIELEPQRCQDCERWRERVRELELKVEALTSALSAREMESASMRARVGDRRYHGKNEAQLIQECESLRITTEYLYYKLERYEKKLNGSHPEIH